MKRTIAALAVLVVLAGCSQPESKYKAQIMQVLDPWSSYITDVTAQSDTTAVVHTTLSTSKALDMGPAEAMCRTVETATTLNGLVAVRIISSGGKVMRSCVVPQ